MRHAGDYLIILRRLPEFSAVGSPSVGIKRMGIVRSGRTLVTSPPKRVSQLRALPPPPSPLLCRQEAGGEAYDGILDCVGCEAFPELDGEFLPQERRRGTRPVADPTLSAARALHLLAM